MVCICPPATTISFSPLKQALVEQGFQSDIQEKLAVHDISQQQPVEFFKKGILCLVTQWDACVNVGSDFV
jgi:hypothetical protein